MWIPTANVVKSIKIEVALSDSAEPSSIQAYEVKPVVAVKENTESSFVYDRARLSESALSKLVVTPEPTGLFSAMTLKYVEAE